MAMWKAGQETTLPAKTLVDMAERGVPLPARMIIGGNVKLRQPGSPFRAVEVLRVDGDLTIDGCRELDALPKVLLVNGGLNLLRAQKLIHGPSTLRAKGSLLIGYCPRLESLADQLDVDGSLRVRHCGRLRSLPNRTCIGADIRLEDCPSFETLDGLSAANGNLEIQRSGLRKFSLQSVAGSLELWHLPLLEDVPLRLHVGASASRLLSWSSQRIGYRFRRSGNLEIGKCERLRKLPGALVVEGAASISGCARLESLSNTIWVGRGLELEDNPRLSCLGTDVMVRGSCGIWDCPNLAVMPEHLVVEGSFESSELRKVTSLGRDTRIGRNLILNGLNALRQLPPGLKVGGAIDLAGSGLTEAPMHEHQLRWGGIPISARVAFRPQTLTVEEILSTENVAIREVMLERFGYERFTLKARPETLDEDADRGGERRLLRIRFPRSNLDERFGISRDADLEERGSELVCLTIHCPSTGALYILRVPPEMRTCRQAAAWIAGFNNPDHYKPEQET